jgi:hypothetical protein
MARRVEPVSAARSGSTRPPTRKNAPARDDFSATIDANDKLLGQRMASARALIMLKPAAFRVVRVGNSPAPAQLRGSYAPRRTSY